MADKTKVYGLILPKKKLEQTKTKQAQPAFNVFGHESDDETKPDARSSLFGQNAGPSKIKRQTQVDIDKALKEDPSVYEYDNIYDEMQANKQKGGAKEQLKSSNEKKPRYIMGLLKASEQKKKEEERRKERQVQKEREAEGEMFADKEKFVTTAYKQKMLAMQEEEEKEKKVAAIEALIDVTKQKDMSGFYRYLYRQSAGNEVHSAASDSMNVKIEDTDIPEVKTEPDASPRQRSRPSSETSPSSESSLSERGDSEAVQSKKKAEFFKSNRPKAGSNFRKRTTNSSSSDSEKVARRSKAKKSSLSKSTSPRRKRHNRDYSRKTSSSAQSSKRRRSQSRSPVNDSRRIERSRSRERFRKDYESQDTIRQNPRSKPGEKFRRSRSNDNNNRKSEINNIERVEPSRSHSSDRKRKDSISRSPSSEDSSGKSESLRSKSTDQVKKLHRSRRTEVLEQDKGDEKRHKNRVEKIATTQSEDIEDVGATSKLTREKAEKVGEAEVSLEKPAKLVPVDPAKKVYPHHNSYQDIQEARQRYLQRKAAKEGAA